MEDDIILPDPDRHPWLRNYRRLVVIMTIIHMVGSLLNNVARFGRLPHGSEFHPAMIGGAIFEVGIQFMAGACLWSLVESLQTSKSRAFRITLALILTVYPCVCLMLPLNFVAGLIVIVNEIRAWQKKQY